MEMKMEHLDNVSKLQSNINGIKNPFVRFERKKKLPLVQPTTTVMPITKYE